MKRAITALGTMLLLPIVLAGCGGESIEDATPRPDAAVLSYLELMDDLAAELARLVAQDDSKGSIERVISIASELEGYLGFFVTLDEGRRAQILDTYGDRLRQTAERVASLATTAQEVTGEEGIGLAIQRIPAFAIVSSTTDR